MEKKIIYPTHLQRSCTFVALLVIFSLNSHSQSPDWLLAKGIGGTGGDVGQSIAIDRSGNIYTVGYFEGTVDFDPGAAIFNLTSVGGSDIFVCKLDASGNFIWAEAIGGTGYDVGYSIALDSIASGAIYCTGYFTGTADFDPGAGIFNLTCSAGSGIFILKLNSSGSFVWAKAMEGSGGGAGHFIAIDHSGNGAVYTSGFFLGTIDSDPGTGVFNLSSNGSVDVFISKLDTSGSFIWAKAMGGASNDWGTSISLMGNGDIFTSGSFQGTADFDPGAGVFNLNSTGGYDIFISKLDSSGNFVWAIALGGTGDDQSNSLAHDAFGNIYTSGFFSGTIDFDPGMGVFNLTSNGSRDIFISKLGTSGNFVWAKTMGGINSDAGISIAVDYAGTDNIYASGNFEGTVDFDPGAGIFNLTSAGSTDIFISKLDSAGNFVWAKAIGGTHTDAGRCIVLDFSSNVYMTGGYQSPSLFFGSAALTNSTVGTYDIFIAMLDTAIITGMEGVQSENGISIYPNPANSQFTIHSSQFNIDRVELYNVLGEKHLTLNPYPKERGFSTPVDISQLASGMYFVKVFTEEGAVTLKVLKE